MDNPSPPTSLTQRKPRGTPFQPGNQAAKNRKPAVVRLRDTIRNATKASDVRIVFQELTKLAKTGDMAAIRLFLSYAVGEPQQVIDVTHHEEMGISIQAQIQAMLFSGEMLARATEPGE